MPEREIGAISKARLKTLADGVFAIVPALAKVSTPAGGQPNARAGRPTRAKLAAVGHPGCTPGPEGYVSVWEG